MNPTQQKPITAGEMLEKYAERIEALEEALAAFFLYVNAGRDLPDMTLAAECARKLDAIPVRPEGE